MPKGFKYQTLQPWHYTLYRLSLSFFLRLTMPPLYFIYWDGCLLLSCPGPDDKLSAVSFLWDKVMALLLTGITTLWEKHPNGTEKYLLSASELYVESPYTCDQNSQTRKYSMTHAQNPLRASTSRKQTLPFRNYVHGWLRGHWTDNNEFSVTTYPV